METNTDDFTIVFKNTMSFIEKLKSQPIELKSQDDIDFVHGKIYNLTIWLSGSCDLMYLDLFDEIESIINKIYDESTISEYSNCIRDICEPIDFETLTNLTNEIEHNLFEPKVKLNNSSVTIEELTGGQHHNKKLYFNLFFIIIFSIISIISIYWSYLISSGQITPTIGQTVKTLGSQYQSPKPYVIKSEFQIYDYVISRLFLCIVYFFSSIFFIKLELKSMELEYGQISFVKLLNLTFGEQNQVVQFITNKIEKINQNEPDIQRQTIEIPELKKIKAPITKPELSITHQDIFIKEAIKNTNINGNIIMQPQNINSNIIMQPQNINSNIIMQAQNYNQKRLNEIKEVEEKKNIFKLLSKCIPSIFKKVKKVKK